MKNDPAVVATDLKLTLVFLKKKKSSSANKSQNADLKRNIAPQRDSRTGIVPLARKKKKQFREKRPSNFASSFRHERDQRWKSSLYSLQQPKWQSDILNMARELARFPVIGHGTQIWNLQRSWRVSDHRPGKIIRYRYLQSYGNDGEEREKEIQKRSRYWQFDLHVEKKQKFPRFLSSSESRFQHQNCHERFASK